MCSLLVSACASTWTLVNEKNNYVQLDEISFTLPSGWVLYNNHYNNYKALVNGSRVDQEIKRVVVTRNGLNLDFIDILQFDVGNAFPSLGKAVDSETLPSEMAELLIAEHKITLGIDNLQLVKNEPVVIAGQKGVLVRFRFKNRSGLQLEQLVFCFATKDYFYLFKFRAPSLHYYEASVPDFFGLVDSVILKS